MKTVALIVMFIPLAFAGCGMNTARIVVPSEKIPSDYPATLRATDSPDNAFLARLSEFRNQYDLDSRLTYDPLRKIATGIQNQYSEKLRFKVKAGDSLTFDAAVDSFLQFVDRWGDLFNVTSSQLNLSPSRFIPRRGIYQMTFFKIYPYSNADASGFESFVAVVSSSGMIGLVLSECLPALQIPTAPNITAEQASGLLRGKKWKWHHLGGESEGRLSGREPAELYQLLLPRYTYTENKFLEGRLDSVEYRLIWRIEGPVHYFYVDAITGEVLDFSRQHTIS